MNHNITVLMLHAVNAQRANMMALAYHFYVKAAALHAVFSELPEETIFEYMGSKVDIEFIKAIEAYTNKMQIDSASYSQHQSTISALFASI